MKIIRYLEYHPVGRGQFNFQVEHRYPHQVLYQGTAERFLTAIVSGVVDGGKCQHVYLSKDIETARKVEARRGKPVIPTVDAGRMHRDGLKFFLSANGVWLTDSVPPSSLSTE